MSRNKEEPFPWKPDIDRLGDYTMTRIEADVAARKLQYIFMAVMTFMICAGITGSAWIKRAYPDTTPAVAENIECE